MNAALTLIMGEQEKYKTIWHRTYAPLRKALSGTWTVAADTKQFEMTLDADGGYELICFNKGLHQKGRYSIVPVNGSYYIVIGTANHAAWALKIEEIDMWRLKLRWVDDEMTEIQLTRKPAQTAVVEFANSVAV